MRMRFKQRLSALAAAAGFLSVKPSVYPGGRPPKRPSATPKRQRTRKRTRDLYARSHPPRAWHMRHLWPPQERSRRPEWSSAVPGEWSTERGQRGGVE